MSNVDVSVADIVELLGGEIIGSPSLRVGRIRSLDSATASDISFLSSAKYQTLLNTTEAGCVILGRPQATILSQTLQHKTFIVTNDPYLYFARLTQWWKQQTGKNHGSIHSSAIIGKNVQLGVGVNIGALCVIEDDAVIGARTVVKSRVTIGSDCVIGEDCIIHSGVVIGADGFGFAPNRTTGEWVKIEQLGAVRIGSHVEIGANTCIDRGALEDTVIEDGVKLDNLIQIGHNVRIGKHTAMAGCVGVAGSATIGAHCTIGGGAVVLGHLSLADHVHISAASVVTRSIRQPGNYTGVFPLDDNQAWEKNAATLKQLYDLRNRIKAIEKNS